MEGLHPTGAEESDTDTDTDTDSDSDTDADTDTDSDTDTNTVPSWSWGAINTAANADASFVGFESSSVWSSDIGDMNGDGAVEILMRWGSTAYYFVPTGLGAWTLDMSADSLPALPTSATTQWPVSVGDVTGDGMDDVATGPGLLLGRADLSAETTLSTDVTASDSHGYDMRTVAALGDMDGDEQADWMVQEYAPIDNVHVFSGASIPSDGSKLIAPYDAMFTLGYFSKTVFYYAPGDVTGDGLADILGASITFPFWILAGGTEVGSPSVIEDVATATFGSACGSDNPLEPRYLGDLDDDGTAELSVDVATGECDGGFHVFQGGDTLSGNLDTSDAAMFTEGRVSRAGDVNGDGWSELQYDDGLVMGSGVLPAEVTSDDVDIHGFGLSSPLLVDQQLPDLNGDGTGDVVWGNRVFLGRTVWPSTVTDADADATFVTTANEPLSMGGVTDLDGDDYDDLVMIGNADQAVYIFFGQP